MTEPIVPASVEDQRILNALNIELDDDEDDDPTPSDIIIADDDDAHEDESCESESEGDGENESESDDMNENVRKKGKGKEGKEEASEGVVSLSREKFIPSISYPPPSPHLHPYPTHTYPHIHLPRLPYIPAHSLTPNLPRPSYPSPPPAVTPHLVTPHTPSLPHSLTPPLTVHTILSSLLHLSLTKQLRSTPIPSLRRYDSNSHRSSKFLKRDPGIRQILLNWALSIWSEIRRYFGNVFSKKKLGADYYVYSFILDLISFIVIALFPNAILGVGGGSSNILSYINSNQIPLLYFALLLGQFSLILIERIVYLFRSVYLKLLLTYALTIIYHVGFFFWLPIRQGSTWSDLSGVIGLYVVKLISLFLSALQIRHG